MKPVQTINTWWVMARAKYKLGLLTPYLKRHDHILDIGSGNCGLVKLLIDHNYKIAPIDIINKSVFPDIQPMLYDGLSFNQLDTKYDMAMMITVLHHIANPRNTIEQALAHTDHLLIMEDIYEHPLEKKLLFFVDSLVNWEWRTHPHTNKTDSEWQALFQELNLEITRIQYVKTLGIFHQVIYSLRKNK